MSNISFSALVQIPAAAYYDFNHAMNGMAEIDSISREGEAYNANIDFDLPNLLSCIKAVLGLSGTVLDIIQKNYDSSAKTPASVAKYIKPSSGKNKKQEMIDLLGKWHTSKQIEKYTGWTASVVGARLTGLRHEKRLQQKLGPDGYNIYRVKKIAA